MQVRPGFQSKVYNRVAGDGYINVNDARDIVAAWRQAGKRGDQKELNAIYRDLFGSPVRRSQSADGTLQYLREIATGAEFA